jgi:putative SOS response-associated peptidase YedK
MCNLYRMERAPDAIVAFARALGEQMAFPEGVPNFQPRDVRITERAPILRRTGSLELVERRWSWPAPTGKPVFNFRGENRRFPAAERCVIVADGFYEFTAPPETPGVPKAKKKDRWLFTWPRAQGDQEWFGIAGIWRTDPKVGEAWTMLTCEPGPDVAPYHNRQIVLLSPEDCLAWLDPGRAAADFVHPLAGGSLAVERA